MHTIDLLKGQGLPPKTTMGSLLFTALLFVIPILIGALIIGQYAINKTEIDVLKRQTDRQTDPKNIQQGEEVKNLERQKNLYDVRQDEVAKCLKTYLQWTPVLMALAKHMPENMIMDNLSASNVNAGGIKKSSDPNKPVVIPIPLKRMTAEISGHGTGDFNLHVRDYKEKLELDESPKSYGKKIWYLKKPETADKQLQSFTMSFEFEKQK